METLLLQILVPFGFEVAAIGVGRHLYRTHLWENSERDAYSGRPGTKLGKHAGKSFFAGQVWPLVLLGYCFVTGIALLAEGLRWLITSDSLTEPFVPKKADPSTALAVAEADAASVEHELAVLQAGTVAGRIYTDDVLDGNITPPPPPNFPPPLPSVCVKPSDFPRLPGALSLWN